MKYAAFLILIALAAPAHAQNRGGGNGGGGNGGGHGADHDRAREAVERNAARPLVGVLREVEGRYQARMVALEFGPEEGRLVYNIELITSAGQIIEVVVDAETGNIIRDETGVESGWQPED